MTKARLANLFRERDATARRLARVDRLLKTAGRQYSDAHGFRVPLRIEALRREAQS